MKSSKAVQSDSNQRDIKYSQVLQKGTFSLGIQRFHGMNLDLSTLSRIGMAVFIEIPHFFLLSHT